MISHIKNDKSNTHQQGWTIKGIEIETRLALRKAAKKEGMTLGKYCNTKLREAAVNTLKVGNDLSVQSEDIREEVTTQINALREELPEIVKLALKELKPQKENVFKRIFR